MQAAKKFQQISSNQLTGLSVEEAASRLKEFGPNEIKEEDKFSITALLLSQFISPLVLILLVAAVLSIILGNWIEAAAIVAIVLLNAVIGFFQEYRAETAVAKLKQLTAPHAAVLRDGRKIVVEAREVVPKDLLFLEAGDLVAADGELLEASRLQINEAILTGESLPVEKSANNSVFMGTAVLTGSGNVRVVQTGMHTEMGKIAHLISTARNETTPLQTQLKSLGQALLWICLALVAVIAVIGLLRGQAWGELLVFSLSLAVAVVPEGMPAIVTVALALGVQRLARKNAWIRKLPAVETLGGVSVICTDKTGTLTTGQMRVRELWGADHSEVLRSAVACTEAELPDEGRAGIGDPTELAILIAARERGIQRSDLDREMPVLSKTPFDPTRKRMSVYRANQRLYVKGAFENIQALCAQDTRLAEKANDTMAERGFRVLAVAEGDSKEELNLRLLGLIGLADPPRTEVFEAIREARAAGVLPVMITGDHPRTAAAIARELGLLLDGENTDGRVHARATPEEKLNLVREWKSKGAVVAMTGDGVNDAPALREAHIGIAMGRGGTDVTRASADLVLADDNFATIVAAIREGRGVYGNIRKAIVYLLTGNFGELSVILLATVFVLPLPFGAAHLLWINLLTDALPALALIADPVPGDVMKQAPRALSEKMIGKSQWRQILAVGFFEATLVLGVYWFQLKEGNQEFARAFAFNVLVISELFRSFAARSRTAAFFEVGLLNNFWLLLSVFGLLALQLSLNFVPLSQRVFGLVPLTVAQMLTLLWLGLIPFGAMEFSKFLVRRRK